MSSFPRPDNLNGPNGRPGQDPRRGPMSPGLPSAASATSINRAERFEDEKRRLMESCFSKMDPNGQIAESYITHIRVQEDAAYPQSAPPPDSPPNNKKPRVIVVAVKNTGRVRMHKARENSNGSFSIGKTWSLDELTALQSYSHMKPETSEDSDQKRWAGDVGFMVTMAKPYYWQAGTAKEKEFFIASVVKIFKKYTQGKVPELSGFSPAEIEAMVGPQGPAQGNRSASQPRPGQRPPGSSQGSPGRGPPPPRSPDPTRGQDRQASGPRPRPPPFGGDERSQQRSASEQPPGPPPFAQNRDPSRPLRPRPSQEPVLRQAPSQDQMQRPPIPPQLLAAQRLTPQASRSEFSPGRSITPDTTASVSSTPSIPARGSPDFRRERPSGSTEDLSQSNGTGAYGRRGPSPSSLRPSTAQSDASSIPPKSDDRSETRVPSVPPERRRPAIPTSSNNEQLGINRSDSPEKFATPIPSPGRKNDLRQVARGQSQDSIQGKPASAGLGSYFPDGQQSKDLEASKSPVPEPEKTSTPAEEAKPVQPPSDQSTPLESPGITSPVSESGDSFRPGLGPMVKKKPRAADVLRKAANAYGAFKPRAGGAAERFLGNKPDSNEPDGITSVVPAPSLKSPTPTTATTQSLDSPTVETPVQYERTEPPKPAAGTENVPELTISSPMSPGPAPDAVAPPSVQEKLAEPSPTPEKKKPEPEKKRRRRSMQQVRHLDNLGVDASLLEGRGLDFESTLIDFGWGNSALQNKKIEAIEADIRRELGRVEAGSWLGHLEQKDDRVEAVEKMLDKAIAECEELEGLMTLYSVELSSLNDDIAFIEAQGQGLQVQTANQKLLQTELQQLVDTLSITPGQLEALRGASIKTPDGLEAVEAALLLLYKAMRTIDPSIRQDPTMDMSEPNKRTSAYGSNELTNMRALVEKRERYQEESTRFLERLKQFIVVEFGAAVLETQDAIKRQNPPSAKVNTKLDVGAHDRGRITLWQYSPLLLFAREVDMVAWNALVKLYQQNTGPVYTSELRENNAAWKKMARKPTGEEQELLFTTPHEKENESLSTTARKLTVKRSQTLARGLRSSHSDKAIDKQSDKLWPYQSFSGALEEMTPLIFTEQNFIVDFFHATSTEKVDFADIISSVPPEARRGTNLYERKPFEPDRDMTKRVMDVMEEMFGFWAADMQSLLEWAIKLDPLQGVGILYSIQHKLAEYEDTNQDFLTRTLQKLNERLGGLFQRFVEEQIRAIEDTKVKIKKRKGVIAFMKTFPPFSIAIENMIPAYDEHEHLDVRTMVDEAYQKVNKAMFESLKVIAKDSPAVMGVQGQGDPEDKEALNYHILLIENMNHYAEEVDERGDPILIEWRRKSQEEMSEHMNLYVDAVVRRPLGKLMEFIESTESLLVSLASGTPPNTIASRTSHSRTLFKKILSSNDSKEVRRGIDGLRKRVDKHFGDADDPGLSRNLVAKVLKECETKYADVWERTGEVSRIVYDSEVSLEFKKEDIEAWFRR